MFTVTSVNCCKFVMLESHFDGELCVVVQLLANAIAQTGTMSAEQVIKHSDGSEVSFSA